MFQNNPRTHTYTQENDEGRHERVTRATPVIVNGVTDDTPDFDRHMVSLDIPDELFGSSFNTVTNVSKIFGNLIMVSLHQLQDLNDE